MYRIALLAMLLLFVTSQIFGQSAELFVSRARRCTPRGCVSESIGRGMSVCLGRTGPKEWLYATAAHNFDMKPDRVYVGISRKWVAAELIAQNKSDDIALLRVKHSGNLKCAPLADRGAIGNPAFFHRRGGRKASGKVNSSTCLVGVQPVLGDSGSAAYDDEGKILGIVRGYSTPGTTFLAPSHKIRKCVLAKLGNMPVCGSKFELTESPPPPPKEDKDPKPIEYDHSDILDRLSKLEKRKTFDSSNLVIANQRLRNQIVELEKRVEGLYLEKASDKRITAIVNRIVAEKFRNVSGELNIRVRPDGTKETR